MTLLQLVDDWSEVWVFLIPLAVVFRHTIRSKTILPVKLYVYAGFILNAIAVSILVFVIILPGKNSPNNNLFYNLHSLARVFFLVWYFITISPSRSSFIFKTVMAIFALFVIVNFLFFESVFYLSSRLFASESIILIFSALTILLRIMKDESGTNWLGQPPFLICTGVLLYEAITFFIFVFFNNDYQKRSGIWKDQPGYLQNHAGRFLHIARPCPLPKQNSEILTPNKITLRKSGNRTIFSTFTCYVLLPKLDAEIRILWRSAWKGRNTILN